MKESFFKFNDPFLVSLEYIDNPNFNPHEFDNIEINFNNNIRKSDEDQKASVIVTAEIGDKVQCPFYIKVEMCAVFYWDNCEDEELIKTLLEKNAPSLLIGYIRPIISSITSSSRFPTFNLPFVDLSES